MASKKNTNSDEFLYKDIGERLKQYSITRGGVVKLADIMGTTQSTLSGSYINGRSMIGGVPLKKLAEFGCDIVWLLTGKKYDPSKSTIDAFNNFGQQNIAAGDRIEQANKTINEETLIELKDLREINRALFKENIDLKNKLELCLRKNEDGKSVKPGTGE